MLLNPKRSGALVLRPLVGLALLGWPGVGNTAGTWSLIRGPQQPGYVFGPSQVAIDGQGNLYVADSVPGTITNRIQRRDSQGNWSVIAPAGEGLGQVSVPFALAADATGSLYVADLPLHESLRPGLSPGRIQKRDPDGSWSVLASSGDATGQVSAPLSLAVDAAGNLYIGDYGPSFGRIQMRDTRGRWTVIAEYGTGLGQTSVPLALTVNAAGDLYVADALPPDNKGRIQRRDADGKWSLVASYGPDLGQVRYATAVAADGEGNLYVADQSLDGSGNRRIQKRNTQGDWSVVATYGADAGHLDLAADRAGNLYLGDHLRIQKRDVEGGWSEVAGRPPPFASPTAIAADAAGDVYIYDEGSGGIQKRDVQGTWSVIATPGDAIDQVGSPSALAVDAEDNLYVADPGKDRVQKRDTQGRWSEIALPGGSVAVAVDSKGSLYVAQAFDGGRLWVYRIQKRDIQGNWSEITPETGLYFRGGLALTVDENGNLYVAGDGIQKRDAQENWSIVAPSGADLGQVGLATAIAVDARGSLYVADEDASNRSRLQMRDAQGNWSLIATAGDALGQVNSPRGLAVEGAGNLYVADTDNNRVLKYTPSPGP